MLRYPCHSSQAHGFRRRSSLQFDGAHTSACRPKHVSELSSSPACSRASVWGNLNIWLYQRALRLYVKNDISRKLQVTVSCIHLQKPGGRVRYVGDDWRYVRGRTTITRQNKSGEMKPPPRKYIDCDNKAQTC